jgi:uncharacterized protein (TIGR02246 family)
MTDDQQIRDLHAAWGAASRARDVGRILELVTDDCVFMAPGAPPILGKEGVRAVYAQMFDRYGTAAIEQESVIEEIVVAGSWAFWRGTDSITIAPKDTASIRASGYGMGIVRKEDGAWRFARGINNMMPER